MHIRNPMNKWRANARPERDAGQANPAGPCGVLGEVGLDIGLVHDGVAA